MLKNLICLCLVFCSIFLLAGCSTISTTSVYFADGSRSTEVSISVDPDTCTEYEIDASSVLQTIGYLATQQELFLKINYGLTPGAHISHGISDSDSNTYVFTMSFDSFQAYCEFYHITEEDIANTEIETRHSLFLSQQIIQDIELIDEKGVPHPEVLGMYFSYADLRSTFADALFAGDESKCSEFLDKINLSIIKCFPYENRYRSNANIKTTAILPSGLNSTTNTTYSAHIWQGTIASPPSEMLVFINYVDASNRLAWYLLSIGITIIFGTILAIVLVNKANKDEKLLKKITPDGDSNNNSNNNSIIISLANDTRDNTPKDTNTTTQDTTQNASTLVINTDSKVIKNIDSQQIFTENQGATQNNQNEQSSIKLETNSAQNDASQAKNNDNSKKEDK